MAIRAKSRTPTTLSTASPHDAVPDSAESASGVAPLAAMGASPISSVDGRPDPTSRGERYVVVRRCIGDRCERLNLPNPRRFFLADQSGEALPCGWCRDRFGLVWQVVPRRLMELLYDGDDAAASERVAKALYGMRKIDIAALEAAASRA